MDIRTDIRIDIRILRPLTWISIRISVRMSVSNHLCYGQFDQESHTKNRWNFYCLFIFFFLSMKNSYFFLGGEGLRGCTCVAGNFLCLNFRDKACSTNI